MIEFGLIISKIVAIFIALGIAIGIFSVPVKIVDQPTQQKIIEKNTQKLEKTEEKATTTPEKINEAKSKESAQEIKIPKIITTTGDQVSTAVVSPPQSPIVTKITFDEINKKAREATINILCSTQASGSLNPATGSGIIIDKKGVILTNAHIAQYFLLRDYPTKDFTNCVIRVGNPAKSAYKADILYISPQWVNKNSQIIIEENPTGTGEDDYAFLLIKESVNSSVPLPQEFPFVEVDTVNDVNLGDDVLLSGYPAEFLSGELIQRNLYIMSTISKIAEYFTFKEKTIDLISISGNISAQKGSSGSAVMNKYGKLAGIVSTSSTGNTTEERKLRAITASYINRNLLENQKVSIQDILLSDLSESSVKFNMTIAPELRKILIEVINK